MRLAILGAGSWGTALAIVLAPRFASIRLWVFEAISCGADAGNAAKTTCICRASVPPQVEVTTELGKALRGADIVLGVMPSRHARRVYTRCLPFLDPAMTFVSATKDWSKERCCACPR